MRLEDFYRRLDARHGVEAAAEEKEDAAAEEQRRWVRGRFVLLVKYKRMDSVMLLDRLINRLVLPHSRGDCRQEAAAAAYPVGKGERKLPTEHYDSAAAAASHGESNIDARCVATSMNGWMSGPLEPLLIQVLIDKNNNHNRRHRRLPPRQCAVGRIEPGAGDAQGHGVDGGPRTRRGRVSQRTFRCFRNANHGFHCPFTRTHTHCSTGIAEPIAGGGAAGKDKAGVGLGAAAGGKEDDGYVRPKSRTIGGEEVEDLFEYWRRQKSSAYHARIDEESRGMRR